MFGQFAYKTCLMAVVCAADGNIGLATAPDYIEIVNLHETLASGRRKAEHDLT